MQSQIDKTETSRLLQKKEARNSIKILNTY